jgi:hypothetical protein
VPLYLPTPLCTYLSYHIVAEGGKVFKTGGPPSWQVYVTSEAGDAARWLSGYRSNTLAAFEILMKLSMAQMTYYPVRRGRQPGLVRGACKPEFSRQHRT